LDLGESFLWFLFSFLLEGGIWREIPKKVPMFMEFYASERDVFIVYGLGPFLVLVF
jgi:hypothetical protein